MKKKKYKLSRRTEAFLMRWFNLLLALVALLLALMAQVRTNKLEWVQDNIIQELMFPGSGQHH